MDWKSLIAELQGLGLSQTQIAEVCGCGQSAISGLARGVTKDPGWSIGERLRRLLEAKKAEAAEGAVAAEGEAAVAPSGRRSMGSSEPVAAGT